MESIDQQAHGTPTRSLPPQLNAQLFVYVCRGHRVFHIVVVRGVQLARRLRRRGLKATLYAVVENAIALASGPAACDCATPGPADVFLRNPPISSAEKALMAGWLKPESAVATTELRGGRGVYGNVYKWTSAILATGAHRHIDKASAKAPPGHSPKNRQRNLCRWGVTESGP